MKKKWVRGDESIAPFPCSVTAGRCYAEERKIDELLETRDASMSRRIQFFDKKFKRINVVSISSLGNFGLGSLYKFGELKAVRSAESRSVDYFSGFSSCIMYYYPNTNQIRVELISHKKFYVEQSSYKTEKYFDELNQEFIDCYTRGSGHKFCCGLYIMDKGNNEWYEKFIAVHSWLADANYFPVDNDSHILGKYVCFDGEKSVSGLTVLHRSNNPYQFFKSHKIMVLITENSVYD